MKFRIHVSICEWSLVFYFVFYVDFDVDFDVSMRELGASLITYRQRLPPAWVTVKTVSGTRQHIVFLQHIL